MTTRILVALLSHLVLDAAVTETIQNPAAPRDGATTLDLNSRWRVTSTAEHPLSAIVDVDLGPSGRTYVLDAWHSQILVISPAGQVEHAWGDRGAAAPGAFLHPTAMFVERDASLGVLQARPPRIARLSSSGAPLPDLVIPRSDGTRFLQLLDVQVVGDAAVISTLEGHLDQDQITTTHRLQGLNRDGSLGDTLLHHSETRSPGDVTPGGRTDFRRRWQLLPEGGLAVAPTPLEYRIDRLAADGTLTDRVQVAYQSRRYDEGEIQRMRAAFADRPTPVHIPEFDLDIHRIFARGDGELWVLTSHGHAARGPGIVGVFDVVDAAGIFRRSVELRADFDPQRDTFEIEGDLLFVVENGLEARRSLAKSVGGSVVVDRDANWDPTERPLAVTAYELPSALGE